jgi:hypothetical protein
MLSQTVQHPKIMYIVAAILISKTFSLYQIYGFGTIIFNIQFFIIIINNNNNNKRQLGNKIQEMQFIKLILEIG